MCDDKKKEDGVTVNVTINIAVDAKKTESEDKENTKQLLLD